MNKYLQSSEYINWRHPDILAQATRLAENTSDVLTVAKKCFEFVRDEIKHSWDYQLEPVTCKAEDVLNYGTGYCFAKSHLLAALLRANNIAAGLCYQRLLIDNEDSRFALHGLNGVFLESYGWYRIDPRGNSNGTAAAFSPPTEKLAFTATKEGEADLPEIWAEPLAIVTRKLESSSNCQDMADNLPDVELITTLN